MIRDNYTDLLSQFQSVVGMQYKLMIKIVWNKEYAKILWFITIWLIFI